MSSYLINLKYFFKSSVSLVFISLFFIACESKNYYSEETSLNDTGIVNCKGVSPLEDCNNGRDKGLSIEQTNFLAGGVAKIGGGSAGFDFTKLDKFGNSLANQNKSWVADGTESLETKWSCVKDNVTGLIWEVKTDPISCDENTLCSTDVHSKYVKYSWGGASAKGRTYDNRRGAYFDDWNTLVGDSNKNSFCGLKNWRVPTMGELLSISHLGVFSPTIDSEYFPNNNSFGFYWSTLPASNQPSSAWALAFVNSLTIIRDRADKYNVRLVSSAN